jgi:hypothetical protein
MNCPFCNSPDIKRENGKMFCQGCGYEVDALLDPAGTADPVAMPAGMVKCPVCSHRVSAQAASCPSCGQPLKPAPAAPPDIEYAMAGVILKWIFRGILAIIIFCIIYYLFIGPALASLVDSYMHSR